jgi:hypothetical protein
MKRKARPPGPAVARRLIPIVTLPKVLRIALSLTRVNVSFVRIRAASLHLRHEKVGGGPGSLSVDRVDERGPDAGLFACENSTKTKAPQRSEAHGGAILSSLLVPSLRPFRARLGPHHSQS